MVEPEAEYTHDSIARQDNGIRIPWCPVCENPVMIEHSLSTGKFAQCPWEECGAWLTYEVEVTAEAYDTREEAKAAYPSDDFEL